MTIRSNLQILILACLSTNTFAQVPFETIKAELKNLPRTYVQDAQIEAVNQSTVSSETTGRVIDVAFDVGDHVQQGAVLIRISKTEQKSGLSAARAAEQEAEVRLIESRSEYTRVKDLIERQLVAAAAFDQAKANLSAAEQRVEAAKANSKQALAQLNYTAVKAPYSGVVVKRHVQIGETVAPGKPIMTGLSLSPIRVTAQIPQRLLKDLGAKVQVSVLFDDPALAPVKSLNVSVSPQADPVTHTFTLRADLPQLDDSVLPGSFVKLAIAQGEETRLTVPASAVVRRSELTALYVLGEGDQVQFRQVRVGRRDGDNLEILAGLQAGERVALDPIRAGIELKNQRSVQH